MSDVDRNCRVWLGNADYVTLMIVSMAFFFMLAICLLEINEALEEIRDRLPVAKEKPSE